MEPRPWRTPWPPMQISDVEWVIVRDDRENPAAVVRRMLVGERTVFRVVTWAPTSDRRRLVGYFDSLALADQAVLFRNDAPQMPDIRHASGH